MQYHSLKTLTFNDSRHGIIFRLFRRIRAPYIFAFYLIIDYQELAGLARNTATRCASYFKERLEAEPR